MNERDTSILKEIIAHCESIDARIEKHAITQDAFVENTDLQDMLLMPIFQIGELSNSISEEVRREHAKVSWRELRAFRNIIAHDYGIVDPFWAWNTITMDIPALKAQICAIL